MADPVTYADFVGGGWRACAFQPFRPGVDISWLAEGEPALALLRYRAGACVPRHRHIGAETILVLDGAQSDERGCYRAGALVLNPVGSEHAVWSHEGCVVLIQWAKPVEFLTADEDASCTDDPRVEKI